MAGFKDPIQRSLRNQERLYRSIFPHRLEDGGGGERVRTDGLLRARQALSQLSYTPESIADLGLQIHHNSKIPMRLWWAWMELNHRPHAYQACALTKLSYRPPMILDLGSRIADV